MKKILISISLLLAINLVYAGGLVTNTNQSAAWSRMLARDASTSIDAVYYNPAGLTKLSDGLHISISNQSIFQNRTLTNSFAYLNSSEFEGKVSAPFFPNFYAAYKTGKFAFSLGFTPIGGGGSAKYDKGVPMIERPMASLVPTFADYGVTGYSVNANFEGSSIYFGIQGGISYEINDMISVYAGGRYVWANNTYKGSVSDIMVTTPAGSVRADAFMNGLASNLTTLSNAYVGLGQIVTAGYGGLTLTQAQAAGLLTAEQKAGLDAGLMSMGYTQAQVDVMPISTAQPIYQAASPVFAGQAAALSAGAALMDDQAADVKQTGNGFIPILGINLSLMEEKLNIGIKYEFQTNMELTNETQPGMGFVKGIDATGNPVEMFPDGAKTNADIPAQLSIGASYKVTDALKAHVGFHSYFDKNAGWTKTIGSTEYTTDQLIDKNYMELAFGLEYNVTDQFLLSAGYLRGQTGADRELYNDDLSYSLMSNTFGAGGAYKINDMLTLQLGAYYTKYENGEYWGVQDVSGVTVPFSQKYEKTNMAFAIGLDFTFGGGGE